LNPKTSVY